MSYLKVLSTLGLALSLSVSVSATTSPKFRAISEQLVSNAYAALSGEDIKQARDFFERALVANPANINALVGLGKTHEVMGSVGKGLKYYRQALEIEPNDHSALENQAIAFLKRDMSDRAQDNLDKLVRLCPNGCSALSTVQTAVDKHTSKVTAQKQASGIAEKSPQS